MNFIIVVNVHETILFVYLMLDNWLYYYFKQLELFT